MEGNLQCNIVAISIAHVTYCQVVSHQLPVFPFLFLEANIQKHLDFIFWHWMAYHYVCFCNVSVTLVMMFHA